MNPKMPRKSKTQIPDNNLSFTKRVEKIGFKFANNLHKFGVFSVILFIFVNLYIFGKEYNSHWRARRVNILIYL
jgi:hypothetical protein